nr:MAG TPA: hypothetical protein [Caudoviricetes sp.]
MPEPCKGDRGKRNEKILIKKITQRRSKSRNKSYLPTSEHFCFFRVRLPDCFIAPYGVNTFK